MALKKKLSKEEYEKLSDTLKAEYIADGDDFKLDVEGEEDTGALKRAKDREAQLRRDAEKKAKELEDRLADIEGDDARKKGDIATLEKSWQKKMDDQKAADKAVIDKLTNHTKQSLVDNVALSIASKISSSPNLILPHIKARLQADFEGDVPTTRVLDAAGKPSALTIEELSKEFVANKDFSAIIIGSKASGGAGKPTNSGGATNTGTNKIDFSKMNPVELAAHITESKNQTT